MSDIKVTLPDGSKMSIKKNQTPLDVAKKISEGLAKAVIAAKCGEHLVDLTTPLTTDCPLKLIKYEDKEGREIFNHSASHVMAKAILEVFPDAKLTIGPAIEEGFYYDIKIKRPLVPEDLMKIERKMAEVVKEDVQFRREEISVKEALKFYKGNKFKTELIREIVKKEKPKKISFYSLGKFRDLCRGPHVPSSGYIKAFKLTKISSSYWRGDSSKDTLQRIYGVAFPKKSMLDDYLKMLEEAEKRDHRRIGKEMGLFSFHDESPGMAFMHPKGMILWNELMKFWREEHEKDGYIEIRTPIILDKELWKRSGHWKNYRENMYTLKIDGRDFAIKPMNCPGGMLWFNEKAYSYRDMPMRVAEVGLVHRHELSGVLAGMFRVREFHQDDAHIYMMPEQVKDEVLGVLRLMDRMYKVFGLSYHLELSTRPKKSIGTARMWKEATDYLKAALKEFGKPYKINKGDGAFYGPKIDIHLRDAIGRTWQTATIQVDMANPERFDLGYVGRDNLKHRPVMIHRTVYGGIERFVGILVEHYAGKFPLWLAPVQVKVLTVSEKQEDYAKKVIEDMKKKGLRVESDLSANTVEYKIRNAQLEKVPYTVVVGDKEVDKKSLAVRTLDGKVKFGVKVSDFVGALRKKIEKRELN